MEGEKYMERKKKKLKPRNDGDRDTHAAGRCGGNGEAGGEKLAWTIGPRRTRVTRWMDMLSLSSLFGGFIELHGPWMLHTPIMRWGLGAQLFLFRRIDSTKSYISCVQYCVL
jgi:hypothetical protein